MRTQIVTRLSRRTLLGFTALFAIALPAAAQRPPIQRTQTFQVKSDRVGDFEAAVKEYNGILKTIPGVKSRAMYRSATGPSRYMLSVGYADWAELEGSPATKAMAANPELARVTLRINACFESTEVRIAEVRPELSTPDLLPEPPVLIRIGHSRILSGKNKEYEAILKNEVLPGYLKAGHKSYVVRRVRFGGPTTDYYDVSRMQSWADAETTGLPKAMRQGAYDAMVAKLGALSEFRQVDVYRYRADLTFNPPPAK